MAGSNLLDVAAALVAIRLVSRVTALQQRVKTEKLPLSAEHVKFVQEQVQQRSIQMTHVPNLATLLQQGSIRQLSPAPIQANAMLQQVPVFSHAAPTHVSSSAGGTVATDGSRMVVSSGTQPVVIKYNQPAPPQALNIVAGAYIRYVHVLINMYVCTIMYLCNS